MNEWKEEFEGKKILIWGYGMEGKSSARFISSLLPEQDLFIADTRKKGEDFLRETAGENSHFHPCFQEEIDFNEYDLILKSPGIVVPPGIPAEKISGQAPLFLKHYRDRIIGITGTKGKSTTSSLCAAVLGKKYGTHLVGNIGRACFDVIPELEEDDLIVFEISCHQLEYAQDSPYIGVYLNLYEEHLDHYGSFEAYGRAKDQIFLHQKAGDILIIQDAIEGRCPRENKLVIGRDIYNQGRQLFTPSRSLSVENCSLIGSHNFSNLAVVLAVSDFYGISDEDFLAAAASFSPLAHRLQDLGEYNGIRYVDDSISTIGQSCIQALQSLPETAAVLIGGMDRGIDYSDLENYLESRDDLHVIFMYASGSRVLDELHQRGSHNDKWHLCQDLFEAVSLAKQVTPQHRVCLLSPAASSYDHFRNFEERGEVFERLVSK